MSNERKDYLQDKVDDLKLVIADQQTDLYYYKTCFSNILKCCSDLEQLATKKDEYGTASFMIDTIKLLCHNNIKKEMDLINKENEL